MSISKKYQIVLIFAIALLTGTGVQSQSMIQGETNQELEELAKEKRDMWTMELSLTDEQALLMEKKIIEYAKKKTALIQSKMREEAKTEKLKVLQREQYKDMRNILTGPQYERYISMKSEQIEQEAQDNKN